MQTLSSGNYLKHNNYVIVLLLTRTVTSKGAASPVEISARVVKINVLHTNMVNKGEDTVVMAEQNTSS